jgi:hypothetical protein
MPKAKTDVISVAVYGSRLYARIGDTGLALCAVRGKKARMMLGSWPKRIALSLFLGLLLAGGLIMACLFLPFRNLTAFVWFPASWLVHVSDAICPPSGAKCVFGLASQGSHLWWFGTCLLIFWWASLSIASWIVFALARGKHDSDSASVRSHD